MSAKEQLSKQESRPLNKVFTHNPEATGQAQFFITSQNEAVMVGPGQQYIDQPREGIPPMPLRMATAEEFAEAGRRIREEHPELYRSQRRGIPPRRTSPRTR